VVGIDDEACGQIAAETLLARGYKRLAFLGGPEPATSTQSRLRGFLAELQRAGGPAPDITFAEAYSFEAGRAEMQRLLRETTPAEAYFCGDDVLSIGALSAIRDHGSRVPEDIGLIGVNDMQMSGWQNINLTTIAQPFAEIIQISIDVIVDMLQAPKQPAQARRLPCRLVERGTLRALP
jgi:DNA-binding LacI/PurR family transcriptional regulator